MRGRVVVFGSINLDLSLPVDHLPAPGETVVGGQLLRAWGGKGANQAVAASRYGAAVHMIGAVGQDEWSEPAREALRKEGVDVGGVREVASSTGTAFILVDERGENLIAVAPGANHDADPTPLRDLLTGPPGVLVTCLEVPPHAAMAAVRLALERGWRAVLNPAPASPLGPAWRSLPLLVTPNEAEAAILLGGEPTAAAIARSTAWDVVVTQGARGADAAISGSQFHVLAPNVQPVDTTGAGDTFNGVLAAELSAGASPPEAVAMAVAAASLSTEHRGARAGMPTASVLRERFPDIWQAPPPPDRRQHRASTEGRS